jgi:AraC-like DNA-binding protein
MQFNLSTDDMPERDRHTTWAGAVEEMLGLQAHPLPDISQPFAGRLSGRSNGPLLHMSMDTDGHRVERQTRDIARRQWDGYWIYREARAGAWFRHAGREFVTRAGDLVVGDADVPFETQPSDRYTHELWMVPRAVLEPHLPALARTSAMRLSGRAGIDALAASYLDSLTRNWDSFSEATMMPVADTLARLIGIACGAAAAEQPDAVRVGRLMDAKRHIHRHLAAPDLSPAKVAAALGISVRTLHLLFEPTGVSFARHVLQCRLEECRSALLGNPSRPVIDIAFAWGFGSLSSFYRAFQTMFGMSPQDLREASRTENCFLTDCAEPDALLRSFGSNSVMTGPKV